ncbi:MAG: Lead, cadmium, zinc and mercury transporting ATPase [Ignavibacteriae bacterium]|nr:MAG: Lead, cadmium, zinc and mercury transporting ATPase [Ignavibacteriota bacterium]
MKALIKLFVITFLFNLSFSQNASDYFPTNSGFKWVYKLTPIDTSGMPITGISTTRIDSFSNTLIYQNKNAHIIQSKIENNLTYDTNYIHFETTNGWVYTKLFPGIDTITVLDSLGLIKFFKNFVGWNSYYRFAQNTAIEYLIKSKDTSIIINNQTYPIRVKISGQRFTDEQVNLGIGVFNCKKFVIKYSINYLVIILGNTFEIPIIAIPETSWIAPSLWTIKKFTPPVKIDLTIINLGKFFINGLLTELIDYKPLSINLSSQEQYFPEIYQNYPNPFNTSTTIKFDIPVPGSVEIKIYNILGYEVTTLLNQLMQPGQYFINWNVSNLPSGVYIYKLNFNGFTKIKKMILNK